MDQKPNLRLNLIAAALTASSMIGLFVWANRQPRATQPTGSLPPGSAVTVSMPYVAAEDTATSANVKHYTRVATIIKDTDLLPYGFWMHSSEVTPLASLKVGQQVLTSGTVNFLDNDITSPTKWVAVNYQIAADAPSTVGVISPDCLQLQKIPSLTTNNVIKFAIGDVVEVKVPGTQYAHMVGGDKFHPPSVNTGNLAAGTVLRINYMGYARGLGDIQGEATGFGLVWVHSKDIKEAAPDLPADRIPSTVRPLTLDQR